jgi:hypothetical protein
MKSILSIFRLVAPALLILPAAAQATFNGPAGAACSGTMSNGQSYSGVQSERSVPPRPDVETRGSKGERLLIKYPS